MANVADSSLSSIVPRSKACSNCRRRKTKCDGIRPTCSQCHHRPPRSNAPCEYDTNPINSHQMPSQMLETIQVLQARVDRLQRMTGQTSAEVLLHQPYLSGSGDDSSGSRSPDLSSPAGCWSSHNAHEPPSDLMTTLVDIFLNEFTNTGYFFLNVQKFYSATANPPFNRPSSFLLNVVYLWACVLSPTSSYSPHTEDTFLHNALQNIFSDIANFSRRPQIILQTIQAEVLLSYYYLHSARPHEGRYHSASAMSLALNVGLHSLGSSLPLPQEPYPSFPLREISLPPPLDDTEVTERVSAFWAAWILNNNWVAVDGAPSSIPSGITVDTPWPGGVGDGATISRFLNGDEQDSFSPTALLAKASTLLERCIALTVHKTGPPDPALFARFATRLQAFQYQLPPLSGEKTLIVTYVLTDMAIMRLHAPYASTSDTSRAVSLAAAARIVSNLAQVGVADASQPILGGLCGTVCSVYVNELNSLLSAEPNSVNRAQYQQLEGQLRNLMETMSSVATNSPITQHCLTAWASGPLLSFDS